MRAQYEASASYGQLARARRANGKPRALVNTERRDGLLLSPQAPQRTQLAGPRSGWTEVEPFFARHTCSCPWGEVDGPIASILGTVCKRKTACKMGLSRT